MSDLYKRIEVLCGDANVNITTMCKEAEVSRASLTDLKMGRKQSLSADTLSKIASYFGVSVDYLLGNESVSDGPPVTLSPMLSVAKYSVPFRFRAKTRPVWSYCMITSDISHSSKAVGAICSMTL